MPNDARSDSFVRYRPEMDGLRAIACLIVLVLHSVMINSVDLLPPLRGIPRIGVWLFFVLSAYLLSARLLSARQTAASVGNYAVGRVLRIFPAFVVAVLLYWSTGMFRFESLTSVLTLQSSAGHLWTIPPEVGFYVALPLILLITLLAGRAGRLVGMAALATMLVFLAASDPPWDVADDALSPVPYAFCFGAGVMGAYVTSVFTPRRVPAWIGALAVAGIVALVFAVKLRFYGDYDTGLLNKHFVFGPLWAVVVYVVHANSSTLLSNPLLVRIGEASFSIYLFHWAICVWLIGWPLAIASPLSIVLSIALGIMGYHLLELPAYRLRKAVMWG